MTTTTEAKAKVSERIADELRKWWAFDDGQRHTHSWHTREDFIEKKLPELLNLARAEQREPRSMESAPRDAAYEQSIIDILRRAIAALRTPTPSAAGNTGKCTCHPDDNPPKPCPQKYALSECRAAAERLSTPAPPAPVEMKGMPEGVTVEFLETIARLDEAEAVSLKEYGIPNCATQARAVALRFYATAMSGENMSEQQPVSNAYKLEPDASPKGEWVCVPREPTPKIGQAIYAAWDSFGEDAVMGPEEAIAIYRAAVAASPPPPAAGDGMVTEEELRGVMQAFWNTWPFFVAWWTSTEDGYGRTMSFDNLPPEPFENAIKSVLALINSRASTPSAREKRLEEALRNLLRLFEQTLESGDLGYWPAEKTKEILAARTALQSQNGEG